MLCCVVLCCAVLCCVVLCCVRLQLGRNLDSQIGSQHAPKAPKNEARHGRGQLQRMYKAWMKGAHMASSCDTPIQLCVVLCCAVLCRATLSNRLVRKRTAST